MDKNRAGVVATAMFLCACGAPPPPFRPVADMKQLMNSIVDPAADVIWGAVGTIVSAEGTEERAPRTDEEWAAVLNSAFAMTECVCNHFVGLNLSQEFSAACLSNPSALGPVPPVT